VIDTSSDDRTIRLMWNSVSIHTSTEVSPAPDDGSITSTRGAKVVIAPPTLARKCVPLESAATFSTFDADERDIRRNSGEWLRRKLRTDFVANSDD